MKVPLGLIVSLLAVCVALGGAHNLEFDHDFLNNFKASYQRGEQAVPTKYNEHEKNNQFWINNALETLKARTQLRPNTKKAKNIILFIGDGMGISTHTAARMHKGQLEGKNGEETFLSFERFPYTGLSKTYCVDTLVADSACTSTAYTNGVKGSIGTLGLNGQVIYKDCEASKNKSTYTTSIVDWAIQAQKSTGLVTTTRITHASPAGTYAHTANRDWESDTDRQHGVDCEDIASQLINNYPGNKINVLMGGGLEKFLLSNSGGSRKDKDLLEVYRKKRTESNDKYTIVKTQAELTNVNSSVDYVLGLFANSHMEYEINKGNKSSTEPTLTEMTTKAIEILSKNKNGFYLFVEGGRIDMAHHGNKAKTALVETIEFANAVEKARLMTNPDETLIVVTADHSHTFTISGYPDRGSSLFETSKFLGKERVGKDDLPYLTVGYNNGPGYVHEINGVRHDVRQDNTHAVDYRIPVSIPLESETHGGEDVAVFATGPWAHLLVGNYEQNYIPIVMGYASRIGPSKDIPFVDSSGTLMFVNCNILILCSFGVLFVKYIVY